MRGAAVRRAIVLPVRVVQVSVVVPRRALHVTRVALDKASHDSGRSTSSLLSKPLEAFRKIHTQLGKLWRRYGVLAIVTYAGVYIGALGVLFTLTHFHAVKGPDVEKWINRNPIKKQWYGDKHIKFSPIVAEFRTAWVL